MRAFLRYDRELWKVRTSLILAGLTALSIGIYLLASVIKFNLGFPLDDSWIHQTYARNLAVNGEWAFLPGHPSAGSTSPLWSALLAIGYLLNLGPYAWTFFLGWLILLGMAYLTETVLRDLHPTYQPVFPWAGSLVIFEWHLVWSAGSGMEGLLAGLICLFVIHLLLSARQAWFFAGLLIAVATWIRPDGITLLGPVLVCAVLKTSGWKIRGRAVGAVLLGFASLFSLYLLFNLVLVGSPWPSTFYAKQAEYASLLSQPFFTRLIKQPLPLITGVGILLLPAFFWSLFRAIQQRAWGILAVAAWMIGFIGLYAWRLPVSYQYGRYILPVLPAFLLLASNGFLGFIRTNQMPKNRFLLRAWKLATVATLLLFWGLGARLYARDVAIIQSEMVATARWVAENVPEEQLVAAHDIGALGFYGEHEIVDLAGLISPEVIPFIRDEDRLAAFLDKRQVDILVTFPDWYTSLAEGKTELFSSQGRFAPAIGGTNMTVYSWRMP